MNVYTFTKILCHIWRQSASLGQTIPMRRLHLQNAFRPNGLQHCSKRQPNNTTKRLPQQPIRRPKHPNMKYVFYALTSLSLLFLAYKVTRWEEEDQTF